MKPPFEPAILQSYHRFIEQDFPALRIRIHGDFHPGQVLWTGRDLVFLDFEGDATKRISERRIKCSPLLAATRDDFLDRRTTANSGVI